MPADDRDAVGDVSVHLPPDDEEEEAVCCVVVDDADTCTGDVCVAGAVVYVYEDFGGYPSSEGMDAVFAVCNDTRAQWWLGDYTTNGCTGTYDMPVDTNAGAGGAGDAALHAVGNAAYNEAVLHTPASLIGANTFASWRMRLNATEGNSACVFLQNDDWHTLIAYVCVDSETTPGQFPWLSMHTCHGFVHQVHYNDYNGYWTNVALWLDVGAGALHFYLNGVFVYTATDVSCSGARDVRAQAIFMQGISDTGYDADVRFDDVYLGDVPVDARDSTPPGGTAHVPVPCPPTPAPTPEPTSLPPTRLPSPSPTPAPTPEPTPPGCPPEPDENPCTTDGCVTGSPDYVYDTLDEYPAPFDGSPEARLHVVCDNPSEPGRWLSADGSRGDGSEYDGYGYYGFWLGDYGALACENPSGDGEGAAADMWVDPDAGAAGTGDAALHVAEVNDENGVVVLLNHSVVPTLADYTYVSASLRLNTSADCMALVGPLVLPFIGAMRAYVAVVSIGGGGGDAPFLLFTSHCIADTFMALADASAVGAAGGWFDVMLLLDRPADTLHYYVDNVRVATHANASCFFGSFYPVRDARYRAHRIAADVHARAHAGFAHGRRRAVRRRIRRWRRRAL